MLATSDDYGETWSPPRLVVDAHSKNLPRDRSVLVGNLWTDPLGRLWLIFDQSMDVTVHLTQIVRLPISCLSSRNRKGCSRSDAI